MPWMAPACYNHAIRWKGRPGVMGLKALWGNRYVAVGLAFWFALVFGAFPTTGPSLVLGESLAEMGPALVPVYSGVCVAVALPLLAMRLPIGRAAFKLMVCACCLQYLGAALVVGSAGGSAVVSCAGGFAYGSGNACSIFAWGILLVRCEDDVRESAFLAALPIAGLILLAMDSPFGGHSLALILLLPLLSLVCFGKSEVAIGPVTGEADYSARGNVAHRPVVVELLKLVVVFGLMGFIWRLYAVDTTVSPTVKGVLFSLGFILAAVVLKLFVQYSAGVDVGSFVRWVFPIAAVGLFFVSVETAPLMMLACVLFAGTHASFEAMMRIRAIGLARRYAAPYSFVVLGWGFAAINIGATAGETLFQVVFADGAAHAGTVVVAVMALLVIVGAVIPEAVVQKPLAAQSAEAAKSRPSDSERRAQAMAQSCGLSAREREILALLLEGRSGPFIRENLGLSKSTVDTHIRHIYQKAGAESRQELIDLALRGDG